MSWSSSGIVGTMLHTGASIPHGGIPGSAAAGAAANSAAAVTPPAASASARTNDMRRLYLPHPVPRGWSGVFGDERDDGGGHLGVRGLVEHVVARTGEHPDRQRFHLLG